MCKESHRDIGSGKEGVDVAPTAGCQAAGQPKGGTTFLAREAQGINDVVTFGTRWTLFRGFAHPRLESGPALKVVTDVLGVSVVVPFELLVEVLVLFGSLRPGLVALLRARQEKRRTFSLM